MKRAYILSLTLFITLNLMAQSNSDKVAKSVCSCLESKIDPYDSQENLQVALQKCVTTSSQEDLLGLFMELGIANPSDPKEMLKVSNALQSSLTSNCESYTKGIEKLQIAMIEKQSVEILNNSHDEGKKLSSVEGVFIDRMYDSVTSYTLRDLEGNQIKIYWLEKFEGSEAFDLDPDMLIDAHVIVKYIEQNIYKPSSKSYQSVKVLKGLEIQK